MVTVLRMMMLSAVILAGTTANARAGILFLAPRSQGGNQLTPSNYTFLGSPPTAWDPGINSAQTGPGSFPSPGSATFSIMGAGFVDASGADGGNHTGSTADITALGVSGYGASNYADDINWALNTWADVSGFTNLGQVADGGVDAGASSAVGGQLGDIRVAAWELTSSSTLAHAFQPGTEAVYGAGGNIAGDVHFDINRNWVDDAFDVNGNGLFDFRTVALHEIGHTLGLGHSSVGTVMAPNYAGSFRALSADDIAGIQAIYGPSASTASVPEPASMSLVGLGLLIIGGQARFRRRKIPKAAKHS